MPCRSARTASNPNTVVTLPSQQLGPYFFTRIGDVLEEDEPQDDVLILGGVHVITYLVGRQLQLGLEAQIGDVTILAPVAIARVANPCHHRSTPKSLVINAIIIGQCRSYNRFPNP